MLSELLGDRPPGDSPPGDSRPYEDIVVILLAAKDRVDAYELLLGPDAVDEIEPWLEWKCGAGDARAADSRRRYKSLALPTVCNDGGVSSLGGDDARRFWPIETSGEWLSCREELSSIRRRLSPEVSSIGNSASTSAELCSWLPLTDRSSELLSEPLGDLRT